MRNKDKIVDMVIRAWRMYAEKKPFESRIKSWQDVVALCNDRITKAEAANDASLREFHASIKRVAELELTKAVADKMEGT